MMGGVEWVARRGGDVVLSAPTSTELIRLLRAMGDDSHGLVAERAAAAPVALEARIAEVLAAHTTYTRRRVYGGWVCQCGEVFDRDKADSLIGGHQAHLAAVLAPVVAGAVERAVEEAAVRVEAAARAREAEGRSAGYVGGLEEAASTVREGGPATDAVSAPVGDSSGGVVLGSTEVARGRIGTVQREGT